MKKTSQLPSHLQKSNIQWAIRAAPGLAVEAGGGAERVVERHQREAEGEGGSDTGQQLADQASMRDRRHGGWRVHRHVQRNQKAAP